MTTVWNAFSSPSKSSESSSRSSSRSTSSSSAAIEPDALITDRVEDTVDYGEVCQVIALISQQRSYKTLERLCAVIADRLASQFGAESVTVKASKPEPPIPLPVEEVSVEVWREER